MSSTADPVADKFAPMKGSDYYNQGMMKANLFVVFMVLTLCFSGFGVCTTCWLFFYDRNLGALNRLCRLTDFQLAPVYLVFFLMRLCYTVASANVASLRRACGCNQPDQYVYKVIGATGTSLAAADAKVTMVNDGLQGEFNRAERGYRLIGESLPLAFGSFLLTAFVFPRDAAIYFAMFTVMRMKASIDSTGQSSNRTMGGLWAGIAQGLLDGSVLTIGLYLLYLQFQSDSCQDAVGVAIVNGTLVDRAVSGM